MFFICLVSHRIVSHNSRIINKGSMRWTNNTRIQLACLSQVNLMDGAWNGHMLGLHLHKKTHWVSHVIAFNMTQVVARVGSKDVPEEDHAIFSR